MEPLVSIITPGWNGKSFITRLLDSILNQTYKKLQYIYVDDGSTDGTSEIVKSYAKKFEGCGIDFIYVYQENQGVSQALNTGLKHVSGQFLCWPEYDDFLTPDSIEKKLKFLVKNKDFAVVTSDAWIVHENNIEEKKGVLSYNNPNRLEEDHFIHALLSNTIFTAGCHMIRMDLFDETHPQRYIFPAKIGPNWQILLPLYYKYKRGFIEEPLLYYLVRENSISHNLKSELDFLNAISSYIEILQHVLGAIKMPEEERTMLTNIVNNKYALERFNIGILFKNENLATEQYQLIKEGKINNSKVYFDYIFFIKHLNSLHIFHKLFNKLIEISHCFAINVFYKKDTYRQYKRFGLKRTYVHNRMKYFANDSHC